MPNFIAKPPLAALGEGMLHVPHVHGERHDRQSATPCQAECALLGKLALTTDDKIYCVYVASDEHAVRVHARKADSRWMSLPAYSRRSTQRRPKQGTV